MMTMELRIRQVVDEVRPLLTPDGGDVELLGLDAGVASLRYDKGHNPRCFDCVMPPEDFREYMISVLKDRVPDVIDVRVVAE